MLLSTSPRRLVLTFVVLALLILSLRRIFSIEHLTITRALDDSSGHNGKGRPNDDANGTNGVPNGGGLPVPVSEEDKVLQQPYVESSQSSHGGKPTDSKAAVSSIPESVSMHSPSPMPSTIQDIPTLNASLSQPKAYEELQSRIHNLRAKWAPPAIPGHWPAYDRYGERDYDPNLWEGFEWNNDFYLHSGIKSLAKQGLAAAKPVPYLPYPQYNSPQWKSQWRGEYVACKGARGNLLNESREDWVLAYPAMPEGFPEPAVGSANVTGTDLDHCIDRYHRFGPYGHDQDSNKQVYGWKRPTVKPEWRSVPWGQLQEQCVLSNSDRYQPNARQPVNLRPDTGLWMDDSGFSSNNESHPGTPQYHHRTALLIRAWAGYNYTENDLESIRSLITELSLLSGGEYQVFLFVNIKDSVADLNDRTKHQRLLDRHVPRELHSISILWNEQIMEDWYPKVGNWKVYWHQFMSVQWFSKTHPQFDFVWNWETDARYTGNPYHFLEQVTAFAKKVPRKHMWERNQRFYFPATHGSHEQWLADTDATIEAAVKNDSMEVVWGAQPYNKTFQTPIGPVPPHSLEADNFEWGVGEEADLITLQPIWEPTHTEWTYRDKIFNFLPGIRPQFSKHDPLDQHFTHPDFVNIPRRTYINTVSRFSKRLLHAMHVENRDGRTMQAEMWPATVALQHGLKAVYAPHPIWTDRKWPAWYMDAVFNADGREYARWGTRDDSVYNHDREHNFAGWSWYYSSEFPKTMYRRWLGWNTSVGPENQFPNNPLRVMGGKEFEERGVQTVFPDDSFGRSPVVSGSGDYLDGKKKVVGGQGRMCLPPMLLHPVKRVSEDEQTFIDLPG